MKLLPKTRGNLLSSAKLSVKDFRGVFGLVLLLSGLAALAVAGFLLHIVAGFVIIAMELFYLESRVIRGEET